MIPRGPYINNAKMVSIDNDILSCKLPKRDGHYVSNRKYVNKEIEYHNIDGVLTPDYYRDCYFITIGNQLGNCLRIITSGIVIANHYKKHAFICINNDYIWYKEKIVLSTIFDQYLLYDNTIDYIALDYGESVVYDKYYGTNYDVVNEGTFHYPENTNRCGIINTIYSVIPETMSIDEFIYNKIQIYRSLNLPIQFREDIESFVNVNNIRECIGIHIRYTDNLGDTMKEKHNFNTNLDVFIKKIKETTSNILLCSDCKGVLNMFRSYKNIIFAKKCFMEEYQGLYEMYLLSNCKLIIGTNSSTFSYESAFIKGTNIELYVDNEWKMYNFEKYRNEM
jgi:hypothetical protein